MKSSQIIKTVPLLNATNDGRNSFGQARARISRASCLYRWVLAERRYFVQKQLLFLKLSKLANVRGANKRSAQYTRETR